MPLRESLNVHFVLERDEFRKASKLVTRHLPPKIRWAAYAQCALLGAVMLTALAYKPDGKTEPVSLIILVLVWMILFTSAIANKGWTDSRFTPMEGKEIWYEFVDAGFRCGLPNAESQLSWAALSAFWETDALFVLLESGLLFYTIPKRSLATNDVVALRELLQQNLATRS
jgi:YcxB-like protein